MPASNTYEDARDTEIRHGEELVIGPDRSVDPLKESPGALRNLTDTHMRSRMVYLLAKSGARTSDAPPVGILQFGA